MPDTIDTNSSQTSEDQGSLVVGKIRPAAGLWPAVEGITSTDPIRNGVLIIFAEAVKGRIGIFCNRYISGAINESTGSTGVEAARELLSVEGGMFGFRPCFGNEHAELAQDIALDLDELLLLRNEKRDIAEALMIVAAPGKGERIRDTKKEPAFGKIEGDPSQSFGGIPKIEKSTTEDSFSYMDWFAADEAAQSDNLPKFRQILMNAVPQVKDPNAAPDPARDVAQYNKLLEAEKAKVIRDIELSMQRSQQGTASSGEKEAVTELKMMSEFIQAEQARAQKWQGLDEIPTPRVAHGSQLNPGNIPRSAEEYNREADLLSVSRHRITLPKDFIKRVSLEEPPPKPFFEANWLRSKWVIGGAAVVIIGFIATSITTMQSHASFEDSLVHAKASLKLQHPQDAVFILNKAIEQDPGNPRAWFYRGLAYSAMGEYTKASEDFKHSVEVGGPRDRALTARASAALRAGKLEDAVTDTSDVLKQNPKNVEALMIRATAYERMKDYSKVIRDAGDALKEAKDIDNRAHLLLQRGVAYMKDGKHAEAEQDLAEAIKIKPDASTYMQLGDAYRSLKDYPHAVADYSRVISYDGRNYEAYVARGISYGELHKEAEAMKDFARALAINKTGVEAMIQRGSLMLSNGHYRLAANDFEDAMVLCPHDAETQQKLAMAYTHLHKTFPKSWLHNTMVASGPATGTTSHTAGGGSPSSVAETSDGAKLPKDTAGLLSVGYKYLETGQVEYATQVFAQAVKNEPNNANARRYLAHALLSSGSAEAAVSQFNALVDLDALTPRDAVAYTKALTNSGQQDKAADVLAQCVQRRPRDISMRAELVRLYNGIGQGARAQICYNEGLRYARSAAQKSELDAALHGSVSGGSGTPGTGKGNDFGG